MSLLLNNVKNATKMITFNNVPTIVHVDSFGDGDKARMEISVSWGADSVTEYYLSINGYKVIATTNFNEAVGNTWWTPIYPTGDSYAETSAYTLARALNNTQLSNDYNIYVDTQPVGVHTTVIVEAKEKSKKYNFKNVSKNANFLTITTTDGGSSDLLDGSLVTLDVYANTNAMTQNDINSDGGNLPHIATFQKSYYKDGMDFNISPVLESLCEDGNIVEYNVSVNYILNNEMRNWGKLLHNYCVNGYQCNLGKDFIKNVPNVTLAQNVMRGEPKSTMNYTTLYYLDRISFSIYKATKGSFAYKVNYLDSSLKIVKSVDKVFNCEKALNHISFIAEEGYYYVDVVLPEGTLRYINVRPNKYTNPSDVQTIYWYNSYGGVSFFPFTAKKEETRESDKTLYKRNNFKYYSDKIKSYQKVYDINNTYEVTLISHMMDKDGTYLFNDMNNAYVAWTYVEGKQYEIIIKNVDVQEQSNNGVYVAKVTFEYSLADRW